MTAFIIGDKMPSSTVGQQQQQQQEKQAGNVHTTNVVVVVLLCLALSTHVSDASCDPTTMTCNPMKSEDPKKDLTRKEAEEEEAAAN